MSDERMLPRRVLWRRIGAAGMDACSYEAASGGYLISGTAAYQEHGEAVKLDYRISCDPDWSSRSAWVGGWSGSTRKEITLTRDQAGLWTANGEEVDGASGLLDIDLGFTPATNTIAIRRLNLAIGDEGETTAVWLDTEDWRIKPLRQIYRRLSETEFAYGSPAHAYAEVLATDDFGIVRIYPQLWTAISGPDAVAG